MAVAIKFECYKSITGGFVAFGSAVGETGTALANRPVWYGCQGETWADLQASVRKLSLRILDSVSLGPSLRPIELTMKELSEETPLLLSPHPEAELMFRQLSTVCGHPRPRVEEFGGMAQVYYLRDNQLLMVLPGEPWKPELESGMIAFLLSVSLEGSAPTAHRFGQTAEEVVDTTLRGSMPGME